MVGDEIAEEQGCQKVHTTVRITRVPQRTIQKQCERNLPDAPDNTNCLVLAHALMGQLSA